MKNLAAFVLSCFMVALGLTLLMALTIEIGRLFRSQDEAPSALVIVSSPQSPDQTVAAIEALNLPRVHVQGHTTRHTLAGLIVMPFELTLTLFIFSGLVFVVFKRVCRRMGIEPIV